MLHMRIDVVKIWGFWFDLKVLQIDLKFQNLCYRNRKKSIRIQRITVDYDVH